ncbi:MAG: phosphopyruvate hydratase [Lachnospiraceae bacterium]
MSLCLKITGVHAREILDSRGNPTVETEVTVQTITTGKHTMGRASVPSGASTGKFEAVELRDGEARYFGLGVEKAVKHVNEKIAKILIGKNALNQVEIDHCLIAEDGTEDKINLGANAMLSVSLATARAAAKAMDLPLYQYLGGTNAKKMPIPMMNILNGGRHADNTVDFQEFMIMPVSAKSFKEGLRMCAEVYHKLKKLCEERGLSTAVGDEGGFAPNLPDTFGVLELITDAVKAAYYKPGEDFKIALDVAASELYHEKTGMYYFQGESRLKGEEVVRDTQDMIRYYEKLVEKFPICSIEDGLAEEDWDGWQSWTGHMGEQIQLVGDDLFVTNEKRLNVGIHLKAANAILVKVNQIGTLTEAMETIEMAHKNGFHTVISHRSGETEDTFISDLAVAVNAGQIKTGAPCRGERTAKYNQLLRIEEQLGCAAEYENLFNCSFL